MTNSLFMRKRGAKTWGGGGGGGNGDGMCSVQVHLCH
jgi:hypothetical protein